MFFKKKSKPQKELCFHEWQLADYSEVDYHTGVDIDIECIYELGCNKCKQIKRVDVYKYNKLMELGLIKNK
nr:hypothetical protein 3 [Bacillaceae bacterium]